MLYTINTSLKNIRTALCFALMLVVITSGKIVHGAGISPAETPPHNPEKGIFSKKYIASVMRKVADWQLANPVSFNAKNDNDWARAAFYTGVMACYNTTQDSRYLDAAVRWSTTLDWKLAQRFRHADDHARGQTFLEIYAIKHDAYMIEDVKQRFDSLIANPKRGREDWWWCDALFMAPPVLAKLSAATGDAKYIQYMNTMFWDTHEYLYDKQENLFYRDESYFKKLTPAGRKTFWARGNGWVMAGIVRILQSLPKNDPYYEKYVALLKSMAVAVKKNQYADGLWRPSLLDENEIPHPETSASSFFCYTLAWSIRNGILDRKEFMPVVERAWTGLTQHVTPDGKLEWVQPIGASPEKVVRDNFQEYGAGAFLLAGSELFILR